MRATSGSCSSFRSDTYKVFVEYFPHKSFDIVRPTGFGPAAAPCHRLIVNASCGLLTTWLCCASEREVPPADRERDHEAEASGRAEQPAAEGMEGPAQAQEEGTRLPVFIWLPKTQVRLRPYQLLLAKQILRHTALRSRLPAPGMTTHQS